MISVRARTVRGKQRQLVRLASSIRKERGSRNGFDLRGAWETPEWGRRSKGIEALETTEHVIAALALSPERDEVIDRLIAAIEHDRAEILASMIGGQALNASHLRRNRPTL